MVTIPAYDLMLAHPGQIWYIDDGQDKYNTDKYDWIIRGKRPALILSCSTYAITYIPFTTNPKCYKYVEEGFNLTVGSVSYLAFNYTTTANIDILDQYIGYCKESTYKRMLKLYFNYIAGEIVFDFEKKTFVYAASRPSIVDEYIDKAANNRFKEEIDTTEEQEHDVSESEPVKEEVEKKKYVRIKYTAQDKVYILTHTYNEIYEKYGISNSTIVKKRYIFKSELNCKEPINYTSDERRRILTGNDTEVKEEFNLNCISLNYLRYMFINQIKGS